MNMTTETALRSILLMDPEVNRETTEQAIELLKGIKKKEEELVHVLKRKDVAKMLSVHRRTLDYYLKRGYLQRVYGMGERAIGISRESYIAFTTRRSTRPYYR